MISSSTCPLTTPTAQPASSFSSPQKMISDGITSYKAASVVTGSRSNKITSYEATSVITGSTQVMAPTGHQPHLDSSLPGLEPQKHPSSWHQCSGPRSQTKSQVKPAIVALYKSGKKLIYFDIHIFYLPLLARLDHKSHEQTAWIELHTLTVRQAQAEVADKLQKTQRDI